MISLSIISNLGYFLDYVTLHISHNNLTEDFCIVFYFILMYNTFTPVFLEIEKYILYIYIMVKQYVSEIFHKTKLELEAVQRIYVQKIKIYL